jgi:hypothetical protein
MATTTKFIRMAVNPRNGGIGFLGDDKKVYFSSMAFDGLGNYPETAVPKLNDLSTIVGVTMGVRSSDNMLVYFETPAAMVPFKGNFKGKRVVGNHELGGFAAIGMDDRIYTSKDGIIWTVLPDSPFVKDIALSVTPNNEHEVMYIIGRDDSKLSKFELGVWEAMGNGAAFGKELIIDAGLAVIWFIDLKGNVCWFNNGSGTTSKTIIKYPKTANARTLAVYGRCPYIISEKDGLFYMGINKTWVKVQLFFT